jgi:hypothetical protein
MRGRTVRVLLIAATGLSLMPGVAQACNDPTVMVLPHVAGPGDTMHYTITNLTPGAKYELSIHGELGVETRVVPKTEATSHSASGTFTMPDLGDRSVGVSIGGPIQHWDIESPTGGDTLDRYDSVTYRVQAPSSGGTPEPQPARGMPPASIPGDDAPGARDPASQPLGKAPAPRVPRSLRATRPDGPRPQTAAPVESPMPVAAPTPTTADPDVVSAPRQNLRAAPVGPGRPQATPAPSAHGTVPERAPLRQLTEPAFAARPAAPERDGPALPLMLVAALSAAVGCAVWLVLLLRRGGEAAAPCATDPAPQVPPDASVEAELQEIVAEERARRMSQETAAIRTGPG